MRFDTRTISSDTKSREQVMNNEQTRREFLVRGAAGIATAAALSTATAIGNSPNERLVVGLIGCGSRGLDDIRYFRTTPNVEVAIICDVDDSRRAAAVKELGTKEVSDFRRILDAKSIDAVVIATPDHWHTPASLLACEAGKHVYVEKPISHNVHEGRMLIQAAERNRAVVQHGTQGRSTEMMIQVMKLLGEGLLGKVTMAKVWNVQMRYSIGHGKDGQPPAGLNYDDWVGPAPMVPYRANRAQHQWRWWYNFGTGDMGNDGVHDLDYARWGLGVDTHPTTISAAGGKFYFDDDQQFPDTQTVTFEYSGDGLVGSQKLLAYEQRLWSTNYPSNVDNGVEFYGDKGQLLLSRRGKMQFRGKDNKVAKLDVQTTPFDTAAHVRNFCDAIRNGVKLNADAQTGHLSSCLCHLGNIATRLGRSLKFDPQNEQVVGDNEANTMLSRQYRQHWGSPKSV
jgi:predicted dehydrogenase